MVPGVGADPARRQPPSQNNPVTLPVAIPHGVSSSEVAAVVLNVTVTQPRAPGFLTVYSGSTAPGTSNVNFVAGQTIANQVAVPLSGGMVKVANRSSGPVQLVVDVEGWFSTGSRNTIFAFFP